MASFAASARLYRLSNGRDRVASPRMSRHLFDDTAMAVKKA
jgi:hypothetical protein